MLDRKQFVYLESLMRRIACRNRSGDVILVAAKDDRKFPVHRLVLRASTKCFDALLGPNLSERNRKNIIVLDIDGSTLETIVHYIYNGDITIQQQNFDAIIDAATNMQLLELKKRCVDFKLYHLYTLNSVDTLLIADKYQLTELKLAAFAMICAYYEEIPGDHIAKIDETNYLELLKSDQLAATESANFNGLVDWLSANNVEESDAIASFLKLIRLRHIRTQVLVDTVEPFFVKHNQREMISDEYRYRALHPKAKIGLRRCNNIYHVRVGCDAYDDDYDDDPPLVKITKYESTHRWLAFRRIDPGSISYEQSKGDDALWKEYHRSVYECSAIVADDKLYVMGKEVCAYDLDDFSRFELPNMNTIRLQSALVVAGNCIYAFGGIKNSVELNSCERFDIENQVWTTLANMPISTRSDHMDAIEHNGLIHVAFKLANSTQLYCYNPVSDTWLLKMSIATSCVVFAKASSSLYVIENNSVLHRYDPMEGALTKIGDFNFHDTILRTVEFNDNIYLVGQKLFGELDIREDVKLVYLNSEYFQKSLCLYVQ